VAKKSATEDAVLEVALDAGALDMVEEDETFDVFTPPDAFESVKQSLEAKGFQVLGAQYGMFPQNYVKLDGKKADQMIRLSDALEEHDDVQNVWANFDIDEAAAGAAD
jgi:transcriptional/translational regulatory protein YebC/TACO1